MCAVLADNHPAISPADWVSRYSFVALSHILLLFAPPPLREWAFLLLNGTKSLEAAAVVLVELQFI